MKTMEERTAEVMRRSRARIRKRRKHYALLGALTAVAVVVGVGFAAMPPKAPTLVGDVMYGTNGNATDGGYRNNVSMHEIESELDFSMLGKEHAVVQMEYTVDGVRAVLEGDDCKPAWDALLSATDLPVEEPESAPETDEDASAPIDVTATATAVRAELTIRFEDGTIQTWVLSDRLLKNQNEGHLYPLSEAAMTKLMTALDRAFAQP